MKPFDYNKYLKNNPLLKESINEATVRDLVKPLRSKLESMGYEVDVDPSFGFPLIEAFKTLPDGSVLRMSVQPSEDEIQKKMGEPVAGETIDVDFTLWTTKVTKKFFGLYKQKSRDMQRLPDEAGINIDLGTGMFDIPIEQSVERVISLLKKAEQKVGAATPTRQMTGDADADFMGEAKSDTITTIDDITATLASDSTKKITIPKGSKVKVLIKRMPKEPKVTQLDFNGEKVNVNSGPFIQQYLSEDLNEFDATSFLQGQMIQQAMQTAPQAMTEADKIITYVLMTVGIGAVAGGLMAVAKDRLGSLNPIPAIKQWWADRQKRKALEPIVAKLKKDPEVMKYVANKNLKGIQTIIKSKLSPEEQKYIGSLTRDALSESILNEGVYEDKPFTQKLYQECTALNIAWKEDPRDPFPIHVEDKKGHELWLRINEKTRTVDAVAQGFSSDIYLYDIAESGLDIANFLKSMNSQWFRDNDPEGGRW